MKQYQEKLSGPLLDRIDLQVNVPRLSEAERDVLLQQDRATGPDSSSIRKLVMLCRGRQLARTGCSTARSRRVTRSC